MEHTQPQRLSAPLDSGDDPQAPRSPRPLTIHKRLLALSRDKEIPRWCKLLVIGGLAIPGPIDELLIYPLVMIYIWVRKRHVLTRHGFAGVHALAALLTLIFFMVVAGLGAELLLKAVHQ